MSVPKSRRTTAPTEYMWQAAEVDKMIGQLAIKLPKRWERTRTHWILKTSDEMLEAAVCANDVYVTSGAESEIRLAYLTEAHAKCAVLGARISRIKDEMPFSRYTEVGPDGSEVQVERPCVSDRYMELAATAVQREMVLLKGAIAYERKRMGKYGRIDASDGT